MTDQVHRAESQPEARNSPRTGSDSSSEYAQPCDQAQASSAIPAQPPGESPVQRQAALLNNPSLTTTRRQALVAQMSRTCGNRRMQSVLARVALQRTATTATPVIQRENEFANRPPTAIEASVFSFSGRDAMSEYLASSSVRMLDTQTALQNASPTTSEEAEQYEPQIERLLRLNAIGLMASHRATIEGRRGAMFSTQPGESQVQPLRDAAANIHQLEQTKETLEEYLSNLRVIESRALLRRGDLSDLLDELALNSNRILSASERHAMVERYYSALNSNSRSMMWLFVYGSAGYMQRKREAQIDAVNASLSLFFQNFPVFASLDAEDVAEGDFADDRRLEMQARQSFARVLLRIDDTIRDIHSGDKNPLDMPEVIRVTRPELPPPLQPVLDDMKESHEQFQFWLNMGLTAAEILLAFVPVIGPALALGVGAANLALQGEAMIDQMEMAEAGANPYGSGPLGVSGPSAFEQTMFGVTAILTAVGAGSVVNSLRGGRAASTAMREAAEAAARGGDDMFRGGASTVDELGEAAGRGGDDLLEGGATAGDDLAPGAARGSDEALVEGGGTASQMERIGPVNPETLTLFEARPDLLDALTDNPAAARFLKHCHSPCFPENIADWQVNYLQDFLEELAERGKTLEDLDINPQQLRQQLEVATEDEVMQIFHGLERRLAITEDVADASRRGPLLDDADLGSAVDDGLDEIIGERMVTVQGAHDIGVQYGREYAEQTLGLRDVNWVNPFEFRRSRFGQGFDDVMEDTAGNIWIVEYKGGTAELSPGQMGEGWIRSRIARYRREGGELGEFWASRLEQAMQAGRLRGVTLKTPIEGRTVGATYVLELWP